MTIVPNNALFALTMSYVLIISPAALATSDSTRDEPISPLPEPAYLNSEKAQLGEILFNDTRLSRENNMSCATCHEIQKGGANDKALSTGHNFTADGIKPTINTPTIFNAQYNFKQTWDGSASTLADVIDTIVKNRGDGDNNWAELLSELKKDEKLVRKFKSIFAEGITKETYIKTLNNYLKSLVTVKARFDQYLQGDDAAITTDEKRGYALFKNLGCISCHQGVNVGGNLFQKFGIFYDYFSARGHIESSDYGRMNVTGRESDRHVFKVPSLRNIELTAPYFHDGQARTLEEAVIVMAKTQLGRNITERETRLIVKFLKTLTGQYNNPVTSEEAS